MSSFAQLKEHLNRIKEQEAEIMAQLEAQKEQARAELLESFKAQIEACGFDPEEIALAIAPKLTRPAKKTKTKATTRKQGASKVYVNPADLSQTYSKGPVPAWLKDLMLGANVDLSDKAAVKAYKEAHLLVQGGSEPAPAGAAQPEVGLPPEMPQAA